MDAPDLVFVDQELDPQDAATAERALYRERAHLIAYLAALHDAVLTADPSEPDCTAFLVVINTPAGQMTWHIHPDDRDLFGHVPRATADDPRSTWDGAGTPQKCARLRDLTRLTRENRDH